jgi:N-acetylglucosamine kinase-like BadF-type ATPase
MRAFLGIDGGQSSTTAIIGDHTGKVVGVGRSGPCNHVKGPGGRTKFLDAIGTCIRAAKQQAGLDDVEFESCCAGFSGGPADKEELLGELIRSRATVTTTDAVIALSGATAGAPGIIAIAGTGSIAYGRNAAQEFARAGGWGYIFGDEGGAFDLTRQAMRAILRHEEGWGPATALRDALLAETKATNANELLHLLYTIDFPRPRIAAFAKVVDDVAKKGDVAARNILQNAAQQLATMTSAVRHQIFAPSELAKVAPIGGVFRSELLRERFCMLVELEEGNQLIEPRYGPATGALIEAYMQVGLHPLIANAPDQEKEE